MASKFDSLCRELCQESKWKRKMAALRNKRSAAISISSVRNGFPRQYK